LRDRRKEERSTPPFIGLVGKRKERGRRGFTSRSIFPKEKKKGKEILTLILQQFQHGEGDAIILGGPTGTGKERRKLTAVPLPFTSRSSRKKEEKGDGFDRVAAQGKEGGNYREGKATFFLPRCGFTCQREKKKRKAEGESANRPRRKGSTPTSFPSFSRLLPRKKGGERLRLEGGRKESRGLQKKKGTRIVQKKKENGAGR